jgi:hypothetical protein
MISKDNEGTNRRALQSINRVGEYQKQGVNYKILSRRPPTITCMNIRLGWQHLRSMTCQKLRIETKIFLKIKRETYSFYTPNDF